jgi:hypothetical protein
MTADPAPDLDPECTKAIRNNTGGPLFISRHFGMGVQITMKFEQAFPPAFQDPIDLFQWILVILRF